MSHTIARLCAALVGAVFAVAGATKVLGWRQWILDARQQGVPRVIAGTVPPLELILGTLLIAAPISALVLGSSTTVLLVFTVFIAVSIASGRQTPCACFGARSRRVMSWRDIARNVALMSLLVIAAALQ